MNEKTKSKIFVCGRIIEVEITGNAVCIGSSAVITPTVAAPAEPVERVSEMRLAYLCHRAADDALKLAKMGSFFGAEYWLNEANVFRMRGYDHEKQAREDAERGK